METDTESSPPDIAEKFVSERGELNRLLTTVLRPNSNMAQLLRYVCEKHFHGEDYEIKEYSIAVEVFGKSQDFDSARDSLVRVEAHRLRNRLDKHYRKAADDPAIRIVIPPGSYVPQFHFAQVEVELPQTGAPSTAVDPVESPEEVKHQEDLPVVGESRQSRVFGVVALIVISLVAISSAFYLQHQAGLVTERMGQRAGEAPAPVAGSTEAIVQMMCGLDSAQSVDSLGKTWTGDRLFTGGDPEMIAPKPIAFTSDLSIYFRRRRATSGAFGYNIPLPPGLYELHLHFADAFFGENNPDGGGEDSRIFDILANGKTLLKNFDVISDAGGSNTADVKVFTGIQPQSDGKLHLEFQSRKDTAFLNALQVFRSSSGAMRPIRVVASTRAHRDQEGNLYESDQYFRGRVRTNEPEANSSTAGDELARHERFGNFVYSLPVVDGGSYTATLRFKENVMRPSIVNADRTNVFDVYLNGKLLLDHFRVAYSGPTAPAQVKTFNHLKPNAQGKLVFSFVPIQNYAVVNSIEVKDEAEPPAR